MPRIKRYTVTEIIDVDAEKYLHALKETKRTGTLTLHMGGGRIGSIEWREKETDDDRSERGTSEALSSPPKPVLDQAG